MDFIASNNISLFFVTETWITDLNNYTTATIKSYGYLIHHCFRSKTAGGGVAIVYKASLKVIRIFIDHPDSFESVSVKLKCPDNSSVFCCCVYRTGVLGNFNNDFDQFLGDVFLRYEKLIICGDINIHLDKLSSQSSAFINTISSYGLHQLVSVPTHKAGHLLDVVLSSYRIVLDNRVTVDTNSSKDFPTCDHYPLLFDLECGGSFLNEKKTIKFRDLKSIDTELFQSDLTNSLGHCNITEVEKDSPFTFHQLIDHYNSICSETLDKHAPEFSKSIREVPTAPWFDSEYRNARRERRKAEQLAKRSKLEIDRDIFVHLRLHCNELAKQKKKDFFQSRFIKHNYSQKSLYQFVDMFLDQSSALTLPPLDSLQEIVNQFNDFFTKKIEKIRKSFPHSDKTYSSSTNYTGVTRLTELEPTTEKEIREILKECDIITSTNDPLPASVMKENIDVLLPSICELVNLSLSSGSIDGAKLAHLTPLIKGQSLNSAEFKNYRPISNLSFIGKLIERVVLKRLNRHLTQNDLNINHQSAYKKHHSTETLLVRIVNDLFIASDSEKATVVMLLDLSAAFDTVDHEKLLQILKTEIGIDGTALKWFRSFLCGRSQKIRVGDCESIEIVIKFGVPQGSVLGPVLFNIYVRSLYSTVEALKFNIHGFADDHQIYKSFHPQQEHSVFVNELPSCFQEINNWMSNHYLQLNPGKTESIVFGSQQVLQKLRIHGAFISQSICVRFVSNVKNIGFRIDSCLTLRNQVTTLKSSCFHKLRNLAKMKAFLNQQQMQILIQSLVISSIDYCNALYFGIDSNLLNQLQGIQNRACRIVFGLKRKESVADYLKKLHWLKVSERIEFKILLLTYKALNGLAPCYLSELLHYNNISGSRTPSLQSFITKSSRGHRAFQSHAPSLWNALPADIRESLNVNIFKSKLKTFLFRKSFNL